MCEDKEGKGDNVCGNFVPFYKSRHSLYVVSLNLIHIFQERGERRGNGDGRQNGAKNGRWTKVRELLASFPPSLCISRFSFIFTEMRRKRQG